jgi:monothiol glutaredoxin
MNPRQEEEAATPLRPLLAPALIAPQALRHMAGFHAHIVRDVQRAVADSPIVVVGMALNPHVRRVRNALTGAGLAFRYLEYGSYLSQWRERLSIKLWSGWPTFPQVFVRGVLVGGADLTEAGIADGSLRQMLAAP